MSELFPFRQSGENSLDDAYDQEFEKTMASLEEIEQSPAVSQNDIQDYIHGLGGKPDGPDLHRTNIPEWKNIFLEQWLHLNRLAEEQTVWFFMQYQVFFHHLQNSISFKRTHYKRNS